MAKRGPVHEVVTSRKAPKPVGPYVQAVKVKSPGEMLYVSGQIPIESNGRPFTGDIKRQAEIAIGNLRNIIIDAKFTMDEVVKVTIYLTDMKNYEAVNQIYEKNFVGASIPARVLVQVAALPKEVGIEIDAVAVKRATSAEELFTDDSL